MNITMDPTLEFLWSRHNARGLPIPAADWAIRLLEDGVESESILQLTDRNLHWQDERRLIGKVLQELRKEDLLEVSRLRSAYEKESISEYFCGAIDGWTLITRGCDLFYDDEDDNPGRIFWIRLAGDADEHGGQGICLQYPFAGRDFDTVLKEALVMSGRPLPNQS
ncbi:hypothetical protein [Candidatus Laterigemmans baculatus]|uniref:hypothetical protein n=2 Tax=Candidatus Laterigemmans baculatus TaxID=2770505 RepID=UPI00193F5EE8|nr:hypothetical protein [Candidatus Laterigemmans baculatus]